MSTDFKGTQVLFQQGALGPGADLWVIPETGQSDWITRLDWYLNFQISRAKFHSPAQMNSHLVDILKENELEAFEGNLGSPHLMIACNGQLPAEVVVKVPTSKKTADWINEIHQLWQKLARPSLRIFLPKDFPTSQFSNLWPDPQSAPSITLVPPQK